MQQQIETTSQKTSSVLGNS